MVFCLSLTILTSRKMIISSYIYIHVPRPFGFCPSVCAFVFLKTHAVERRCLRGACHDGADVILTLVEFKALLRSIYLFRYRPRAKGLRKKKSMAQVCTENNHCMKTMLGVGFSVGKPRSVKKYNGWLDEKCSCCAPTAARLPTIG